MADIALQETVLLGNPPRILQYEPGSDVELTASGGATPSAQSKAVNILGAIEISVTLCHNLTGSNSTDLDLEIYTSPDGTRWDTDPYHTINVSASKQLPPVPLTPPNVSSIRWKAVNKDAGNSTKLRPIITLRR